MLEPTEDNEASKGQEEQAKDNDNSTLTNQVPTFPDSAIAGFLDNFKLELTHVSQEIRSLTDSQNSLIDKVQEHNGIIQNSPDMTALLTCMEDMKGGMERLNKLRHDMTIVHERSEKLRNRAEKLESICKHAQKKEEDLVAKMDKQGPSESSS